MKNTESIFGFWNPTEKTVKRFHKLHDVLAKDHARLELVICTLQNESIQSWCSFDVSKLLNDLQLPLGGLGIAFFRPSPFFTPIWCDAHLFNRAHCRRVPRCDR